MKRSTVTFATSCWEKDWKAILLDPDYLSIRQIGNNSFPFSEKLLVINNVEDLEAVKKAAQKKIDEGILTRYIVARGDLFDFFGWERSGPSDWIYYNALGPLNAIYHCQSDYLLYMTGDSRLDRKVQWVDKALKKMEKHPQFKVANLVWNENWEEAERESYRKIWDFYIAKEGFSDQQFLVKRDDFQKPICGEIREDSGHYPRGEVFERRIFSYMKNHGWERITYKRGSYTHANID